MKLLTIGDSFTYGDELSNRSLAWPNLIADKLNASVDNLGQPSRGNSYIVRTAVEKSLEYDIVIVAWSHFARIEFSDDNGIFDIWPGRNVHPHFLGRELTYRKDLLKYITINYNDTYLYRQHLIQVIMLQSWFKQNNIKYLMLDAFENNREYYFNQKDNVKDIVDQVDSTYYPGWPNNSMMEWTFGCEQGPGGHFLEQGHQRVADKIYEHIRNISWIS